jgi:Flp pilus assembly protein TadD
VPVRGAAVAATVLVGALATIGLVGNSAVRGSDAARRAGDWDRAASEARMARTWQPWSPRPWLALGKAQLGAGLVADARASFRRAVSIDPGDWQVWYELARASRGRARIRALESAVALYPRSGLLAGHRGATGRRGRVP